MSLTEEYSFHFPALPLAPPDRSKTKTQSEDKHPETQMTNSQNPNQNGQENQSVQKNKGTKTVKQNYAATIRNQNHKKSRIKLLTPSMEIHVLRRKVKQTMYSEV